MKVEKRSVLMPPPLATETESKLIKHYLVDIDSSFSKFAIEAILEKIERDKSKKQKSHA